jgi:phosphate transport system permease protein
VATLTVGGGDASTLRSGRAAGRGDRVFAAVTLAAGIFVFALLTAIGVFLVVKALPAFRDDHSNFLTTQQFNASDPTSFGIAALAFGTVITSVLALVAAVPVALGVALFITEYAPRRIGTVLGYISDLLAAVPSVIYGLWAVFFLLPHLIGLQHFLTAYFGWIPLFRDPNGQALVYSRSIFGASIILAIMILPIVAAISREVFRQVDPAQREAALALGATRWEVIRLAVLRPSRAGVTSATMLGLGRALGETIAVALVIGNSLSINWHVLVPGGATIASNIANQFGDASELGRSVLIASGLVLFALTLIVNLIARTVITRSGTREAAAV